MLLRDTNNGKLYKFRRFDEKGYALKAVRTGTLHCSKPTVFNDPFDCNLGLSKEQVFEALQPEFIHKLAPELDFKSCKSISEKLFVESCIVKVDTLKSEW